MQIFRIIVKIYNSKYYKSGCDNLVSHLVETIIVTVKLVKTDMMNTPYYHWAHAIVDNT